MSHGKVTVAVLSVNLLWLFPLAMLGTLYPHLALGLLLAALVPTAVIAVLAGAGRPETGGQK